MGLLPPIFAFGAFSLGCLLIVAFKMLRQDGATTATLGLVTGVYAFVWGWQNSRLRVNGFRLRDVMTTWSWCLGATVSLWLIRG